jgi:hypothetical protein
VCVVTPFFTRLWRPPELFVHAAMSVWLIWWSVLHPTASLYETMLQQIAPAEAEKVRNQREGNFIAFFWMQMLIQMLMRLSKSHFFPTGRTSEIIWGVALLLIVTWRVATAGRKRAAYSNRLERYLRELPLNPRLAAN